MQPDHVKQRSELIEDEGYRTKLYQDSIGKWTIGIGWNLTDNGLPASVIEALYQLSVMDAFKGLSTFTWAAALDEVRSRALVNMVFNMGLPTFSKFKKMIGHLAVGEFAAAAAEAEASLWYGTNPGDREKRIVFQIEFGQDPPAPITVI